MEDLLRAVGRESPGPEVIKDTATRIAVARASDEGKEGIRSFLEKRKPAWVKAWSSTDSAQKRAKGPKSKP